METKDNEQTISLLNDLIRTNNDRIEGYEKAVKETEDTQLKSLFYSIEQESRKNKNELLTEVIRLGGTPEEGTSLSGKMYRAWMDLKSALTGRNRKSIIASCEHVEDVTLENYKEAMHSGKLPAQYLTMVSEQNNAFVQSLDRIKLMRDTVKSL